MTYEREHENRAHVLWRVFPNVGALLTEARATVAEHAQRAIETRGAFHIALAGGTTPRALYQSLTTLATDWSRWHVYFGDERVLPVGDSERNSHMAAESWLNHVAIPRTQIHVIPTERGLDIAVRAYEQVMEGIDEFDVVLLGLGDDGHTASLFPGNDWGAASDSPDVIAVTNSTKPPPQRATLSAQRLSRARHVLFLVTGAAKQAAVQRWKRGERLPATAIRAKNGVVVLLDTSADSSG